MTATETQCQWIYTFTGPCLEVATLLIAGHCEACGRNTVRHRSCPHCYRTATLREKAKCFACKEYAVQLSEPVELSKVRA